MFLNLYQTLTTMHPGGSLSCPPSRGWWLLPRHRVLTPFCYSHWFHNSWQHVSNSIGISTTWGRRMPSCQKAGFDFSWGAIGSFSWGSSTFTGGLWWSSLVLLFWIPWMKGGWYIHPLVLTWLRWHKLGLSPPSCLQQWPAQAWKRLLGCRWHCLRHSRPSGPSLPKVYLRLFKMGLEDWTYIGGLLPLHPIIFMVYSCISDESVRDTDKLCLCDWLACRHHIFRTLVEPLDEALEVFFRVVGTVEVIFTRRHVYRIYIEA